MSRIEDTIRCESCGAEINLNVLVIDGHRYCCRDCYEGRPCLCGAQLELDDERRASGPSLASISSGDVI
jgi:hypothetical protein